MKYNILNGSGNRCSCLIGDQKFRCRSNNDVFETTDINLAYEYKMVLEKEYPASAPFTVVEVK
jgi:hypothetical protein